MLKLRKNKKGFTLIELMVVVVIIGILTAIAIPVYGAITANAKKSACQANQRTIDSAVMMYLSANPNKTYADIDDINDISAYLKAIPKDCEICGAYAMTDGVLTNIDPDHAIS